MNFIKTNLGKNLINQVQKAEISMKKHCHSKKISILFSYITS